MCAFVHVCRQHDVTVLKEGCVHVHVSTPTGAHPLFLANPF